ncbi:hypothetical protein DL93DRAFT_2081363, partial [Clavulina sp. PMI_390]
VCSYLHPVDLLHLVQSSKIFALFLLGTPGTWRFGRLQLDDLPEPPEDLTEQQYACLLFGTNCQSCGTMCRISKHTFAWGIRRRWCEKCRDRVARGKDKKYIISKNGDMKCRMMLRSTLITKTQHTTVIHRTHYDAILAEIQKRLGNEQSMEEYTKSREEIIQQEIKRRDTILEWLNSRDSDRSEELRGIRAQRLQDLKGHLEKAGYSARILALIHDREYERFPTMQQSKRLTPQVWEKCESMIMPALEHALVPVHDKVIREARKLFGLIIQSAMKEFDDHLDYVPHRHAFGWSHLSATVEAALREWALIEENCIRLHQSAWPGHVKEEIVLPDRIIDLAAPFLVDCRREVRELFVSLIQSSGKFPNTFEAPETLELATCVFSRPRFSNSYIGDCIALPYWLTHRLDRSGLLWDGGLVNKAACDWIFDAIASSVFHQIIIQAGGDPNTCTREAFLNMAEHVSCLLCDEDNTMHLEASAIIGVGAMLVKIPALARGGYLLPLTQHPCVPFGSMGFVYKTKAQYTHAFYASQYATLNTPGAHTRRQYNISNPRTRMSGVRTMTGLNSTEESPQGSWRKERRGILQRKRLNPRLLIFSRS